jgi:hypothetical protein
MYLDGIKLRNHTIVAFLHEFLHLVRIDNFWGARLYALEGIGVRILSKAHI